MESPASAETTRIVATVRAAAAAVRGRAARSAPLVTTRKNGMAAKGFRIAARVMAKREYSNQEAAGSGMATRDTVASGGKRRSRI